MKEITRDDLTTHFAQSTTELLKNQNSPSKTEDLSTFFLVGKNNIYCLSYKLLKTICIMMIYFKILKVIPI